MKEVILHSRINFNKKEFLQAVKEELEYHGIERDDLAKALYIQKARLDGIINGVVALREDEIAGIRKYFNLSV